MSAIDNLLTVSVSAPGKVILHGEHSVVYGKLAIAACLGLRSRIVIKEIPTSTEPIVKIHLPAVNLEETIQLNPILQNLLNTNISGKFSNSGNMSWKNPDHLDHDCYLKNIGNFLEKYIPDYENYRSNQKNSLRGFLYIFCGIFTDTNVEIKSMEISLGSDLTIGAGTGSSASFAVCLAGALIQLLKLKTGTVDFKSYYKCNSDDFTLLEKEILSKWAFNCERIMHGAPSGVDNATCTFGNAVCFRKGSPPKPLNIRLKLKVLLVDSRVARETSTLVEKVAARRKSNPVLVDHILDALDSVAQTALEIYEKLSNIKDKSDTKEDYYKLEELWDTNHCLLAALGVSHEALERVRTTARAHHLAAKLTGAGGGGYAIVLIPPSTTRSTIDKLTSQLIEQGFGVHETRLGGAGVSLEM